MKHLSDFRRDNPFSHCLPGGPFNMVAKRVLSPYKKGPVAA